MANGKNQPDDLDFLDEIQVMSDTRYFVSVTPKNGPGTFENGDSPGEPLKVPLKGGAAMPVIFGLGRTISLGDFEFARVDVTLESVHSGEKGHIFDWSREVVREFLAREESSIKGRQRKDVKISAPPDGVRICVLRLQYGLTLSTAKYESTKVDVGNIVACAPDGLEAAWATLEEFIEPRIQDEVKTIRAKAKNTGL